MADGAAVAVAVAAGAGDFATVAIVALGAGDAGAATGPAFGTLIPPPPEQPAASSANTAIHILFARYFNASRTHLPSELSTESLGFA